MVSFCRDSADKGQVISGNGRGSFCGVTVSQSEWANCTDFHFTKDDISFRGLDIPRKGLIVVFDSSGIEVDLLLCESVFRLIEYRHNEDSTETFKVQKLGEDSTTIISKEDGEYFVPRIIRDHTVASNLGEPHKTIACVM